MDSILFLIDNGHGENTPGKRSPDGKFREYLFAREIANEVVRGLRKLGYEAELLVCQYMDVSLEERTLSVNEFCRKRGAKRVVLCSIHCNAAGDGTKWLEATGFSVFTSKGKTKSDFLASIFYKHAEVNFENQVLRKDFSDGDPDWEENFALLKNTKCTAIITENFFMDNRKDVTYLTSPKGKAAIIKTHIDSLIEYANSAEDI